jgi:hypothetical protein
MHILENIYIYTNDKVYVMHIHENIYIYTYKYMARDRNNFRIGVRKVQI